MIMDVTHEVTVNYNGSVSVAVTFRFQLKVYVTNHLL